MNQGTVSGNEGLTRSCITKAIYQALRINIYDESAIKWKKLLQLLLVLKKPNNLNLKLTPLEHWPDFQCYVHPNLSSVHPKQEFHNLDKMSLPTPIGSKLMLVPTTQKTIYVKEKHQKHVGTMFCNTTLPTC